MVYSTSTKMLYASVPSSSGVNGNSIASVDPVTGVVDSTVFVGSEPKKLALSDDGHTLYVSLEGAAAIRSFDVVSHALGLQFPLGSDNFFGTLRLTDMAVAPGNPNLVAVSRNYRGVSPPEAGVAVFENGVQRPVTTPGHTVASDFLSFSASAGTLYGCGFYSGLNTMTVNSAGVSITSSSSFSLGNAIRFDNGRVYGSTGQIVNPTGGTLVGTITVQYKQVGVMLAFTPTIIGDRINLKVAPEVSELSAAGSVSVPLTSTAVVTVPAITTRKASTTIELGSGQSFAIAGLLHRTSLQDITKFPWLGDVPVLGTLFKSDAYQREETELVIIITPYLVEPTSGQLRTPLTDRVPPTDVDRLVMQRFNHPTPPRRLAVGRETTPAGPTAGFTVE